MMGLPFIHAVFDGDGIIVTVESVDQGLGGWKKFVKQDTTNSSIFIFRM